MIMETSAVPQDALTQVKANLDLFTKSELNLANYTLKNPFKVSSMSIQQLAEEANVSIATINRFAKRCGFSGYSTFKKNLQKKYAKVFEPIQKAQNAKKLPHDLDKLIDYSFQNSIHNLEQTLKQLSFEVLNHLVNELLNRKRIFVAGMGISTLHAAFLVDAIEPFLPNTCIKELVSYSGSEKAFRQIANLGENDLAIVISLPRYSQAIVDLTQAVQQQGSHLIAITDSINSPLVPLVNHSIFVSVEHPVLYASNTAVIALIEAITLMLTTQTLEFEKLVQKQTQIVSPFFYQN